MPHCSAVGCSSQAKNGVKLYSLPSELRNAARRRVWLMKIGIENWELTSGVRLCAKHFTPDQFETKRADGLVKLKPNAVPTIFCHRKTPVVRKAPSEGKQVFKTCPEETGNAEQHSTKQMDSPNSDICDGSLLTPLTLIDTDSEDSIKQEPAFCKPSPIDLNSKTCQTNSGSNTAQEVPYLGPFVESSSIKCHKCSAVLADYGKICTHSCTSQYIDKESCKTNPKCCFCDKDFSNMRSLQKHLKKHIEKTYVKCSICGKCFTCVASFKMHVPVHTNQWPYYCDICGQGAASERSLELHKTYHLKERSWMCDICGAMFVNQNSLNKHKNVHSERKYECDMCCARFRTIPDVKKHKKIHSVREKFQCGECSSAFISKFQFKLHKEVKHSDNSGGESFICPVCNKEFRHQYLFKRHVYKHKSKNTNVMYTCDICKRTAATKLGISLHIAGHYGTRFSCSQCGMSFTQKGSVKRHMLKVHQVKD